MAAQTPLSAAQREWEAVFGGGPYTGLKMLEYLITASGITPIQYLGDPKNVKRVLATVVPDTISNQPFDNMAVTWNSRTGRCTSLAVKVVHTLAGRKDAQGQPVYDWCIYDLGGHRIARCRKTGIVIDSSSTILHGVFVLQEGNWQRFADTDASWKYTKSESKFERQGNPEGNIKSSSTPISAQAAMCQCLHEIAVKAYDTVPTLFRTVDPDGRGLFWGVIVWAPGVHAIKLARSAQHLRAKKVVTIQWAQYKRSRSGKVIEPAELMEDMKGTEESLETCITTLKHWVGVYGGPDGNGPSQWAADGINEFTQALIRAACQCWGFPRLVDETQ